MKGYLYGGNKAVPVLGGNLGSGDVTYYIYSGNNSANAINWESVTTSTTLNPGIYYMYAKVSETNNYLAGRSNTVKFEVGDQYTKSLYCCGY